MTGSEMKKKGTDRGRKKNNNESVGERKRVFFFLFLLGRESMCETYLCGAREEHALFEDGVEVSLMDGPQLTHTPSTIHRTSLRKREKEREREKAREKGELVISKMNK